MEFAVFSVCGKGTGYEDMKTVAIQKFCVVAALVLLTAGVGVVGCTTDQDGQAVQDQPAAPAADAGLKVYLDPETGEYVDPKEVGFDAKSFRGGSLAETLRNLWADDGRAGGFLRGIHAAESEQLETFRQGVPLVILDDVNCDVSAYDPWDIGNSAH